MNLALLGKTGLAAPIFDEKSRILGAVTLVGSNDRFERTHRIHRRNQGLVVKLVWCQYRNILFLYIFLLKSQF